MYSLSRPSRDHRPDQRARAQTSPREGGAREGRPTDPQRDQATPEGRGREHHGTL